MNIKIIKTASKISIWLSGCMKKTWRITSSISIMITNERISLNISRIIHVFLYYMGDTKKTLGHRNYLCFSFATTSK